MRRIIALLLIYLHVALSGESQSFEFAKNVGGSMFENAMGIAVDSAGNVIICGYFAGAADFDPSPSASFNLTSNGSNDVFLAKYDSAGSYIWAINIGGPNDEFTYADPMVDANGNIYVCGLYGDGCDFDGTVTSFTIPNAGSNDGFIAMYDNTGTLQWAKGFGGMLDDDIYRIDLDANNDILFGGYFKDTVDLNPGLPVLQFVSAGGSDIFFGKLDNAGALVFVNVMHGPGDDRSYNITHDANNDIVLTGGFNDSIIVNPNGTAQQLTDLNGLSSFVTKFSSIGSYQWAFALTKCLPFGLAVDHANNILTSGQFSGPTDFDPGVNLQSLSGQAGSFDAYMAKYTAAGNYVFASRIGGNQLDCAYAIRETVDSTILLSGFFNLTADFDPSLSIASLTSAGVGDVFMARYTATGNYINALKIGGTGFDFSRNSTADKQGNIFLAGGFDATVDFDPGAGVATLISAGSRDGYFVKFGKTVTGFSQLPNTHTDHWVYPNPFYHSVRIADNFAQGEKISIAVFNTIGKKVLEKTEFLPGQKVDLSMMVKGVYYMRITAKNISQTEKLLKL